jgi:hypothetical protein
MPSDSPRPEPNEETLRTLQAEIESETNLFTRAVGWYFYWSLHQIVYADGWAEMKRRVTL